MYGITNINIYAVENRHHLVAYLLTSAMADAEQMGALLKSTALSATFPADNSLAASLKQVAKVIRARGALGTERDVFYVQLGGFDHHNEVLEALATRYGQLDAALAAFVAAVFAYAVPAGPIGEQWSRKLFFG